MGPYRKNFKKEKLEDLSEKRFALVLEAVNATFKESRLSPLSHYMDHVQNRWMTNLNKALSGSDSFIYSNYSWGQIYTLIHVGWIKFFWITRRMSWADRFMWISERIRKRNMN